MTALFVIYFTVTPFAYAVTLNDYILNKQYDEPTQESAKNVLLTPLWPLWGVKKIWELFQEATGGDK